MLVSFYEVAQMGYQTLLMIQFIQQHEEELQALSVALIDDLAFTLDCNCQFDHSTQNVINNLLDHYVYNISNFQNFYRTLVRIYEIQGWDLPPLPIEPILFHRGNLLRRGQ